MLVLETITTFLELKSHYNEILQTMNSILLLTYRRIYKHIIACAFKEKFLVHEQNRTQITTKFFHNYSPSFTDLSFYLVLSLLLY